MHNVSQPNSKAASDGAASQYFTQLGRLGNRPAKKTPAIAAARQPQPPREAGKRCRQPSPLLREYIVRRIAAGEKNQPATQKHAAIEMAAPSQHYLLQ
jgi:hypothetical protein